MNAHEMVVGTRIVIGKREWAFLAREAFHPDRVLFKETTTEEPNPIIYRTMYMSEVQFLLDSGCRVTGADGRVLADGLVQGGGFLDLIESLRQREKAGLDGCILYPVEVAVLVRAANFLRQAKYLFEKSENPFFAGMESMNKGLLPGIEAKSSLES